MMIGSILLIVLGVMALLGIGNKTVKDFGVPVVALVLVFAAVVGLNFLPTMDLGGFTFDFGTALFFLTVFLLWVFKGTMKNRLMSLLITVVLSGVLYGATRIAAYFGDELWSSVNYYYALMIGLLAFVLTRNGKYGFIAATLSVMTATLLTQIGGEVSLNPAYSTAVVAGALSIVLYEVVTRLVPSRPSKASYYYEMGRMLDEE
ncbi:MAG: hypothetical protein IJ735_07270 [Clostridia bacterium]|nr:hypothetical protein [Clostridia bacterium]